jgi:elongation factor Ts
MNITADAVKQLRERTGAGMMECKKALVEAAGDLDAAAEAMRKSGLAKADKKASRVAAEGTIVVEVAADNQAGVLVEVNCETDFVAREADFVAFAKAVAATALAQRLDTVEAVLAADGGALDERRRVLIAKIGENMNVRRCSVLKAPNGVVAGYVHMGGKIGTLVALEGGTKNDALVTLGKDIAALPQLNSVEVTAQGSEPTYI